jgi:hypothetical protein
MENLDNMSSDQLGELYAKYVYNPKEFGELLMPGRRVQASVLRDIAIYIMNKLAAMRLRKDSKIEEARHYEDVCDRVFKILPSYARW